MPGEEEEGEGASSERLDIVELLSPFLDVDERSREVMEAVREREDRINKKILDLNRAVQRARMEFDESAPFFDQVDERVQGVLELVQDDLRYPSNLTEKQNNLLADIRAQVKSLKKISAELLKAEAASAEVAESQQS